MKYVFLFAFIALMAAIGIISRKRSKTSMISLRRQEYDLDKRIFAWRFVFFCSYFEVAMPENRLEMGFSAVWIGIFNALIGTYLVWAVLGKKARDMTR